MTNTKESLGLHAISDGPSGGVYVRANQANLTLKAPPVGTPHFTNWDAGLTSLENTTKERFENRGASRFLEYHYRYNLESEIRIKSSAKDIKIVDNLAAISFPEYTDLRKTTLEFSTQLFSYHSGFKVNAYDFNCIDWEDELPAGHVLIPQFNFDTILGPIGPAYPAVATTPRWQGDIDLYNLFIIVKYTGVYTKNDADPCNIAANYTESSLTDKMQLLKYNPDASSLSVGEYSMTTFFTPANVEKRTIIANIGHSLDIGPVEYFGQSINSVSGLVQGFGKIQCSITLVKYLPVFECGRVDIYNKKQGSISSYQSNGKLVSLRHDLNNGDIIKISDAQNSEINGIRYVQVINDSTFNIYGDADFTQKINNTYYEGSPIWTACGNVYNEEYQSWNYVGSIIGSNNYGVSYADFKNFLLPNLQNKNALLSEKFNDAATFEDILSLDFDISSAQLSNFKQYPGSRGSTYDSFFASLDFTSYSQENVEIKRAGADGVWFDSTAHSIFWTSPFNCLHSFKFGSSIDLVKYKNRYVLAVGQKGWENIGLLPNKHIPETPIYGSVSLFDIYLDSNKKPLPLQNYDSDQNPIRFNSTVYAHTNDSEIATPPSPAYYNNSFGPLFRDDFLNRQAADFALFNFSGDARFFRDYTLYPFDLGGNGNNDAIETASGMDYWYGSMVYNLSVNSEDLNIGYKLYSRSGSTANNCRNKYFTDWQVPEFLPINSSYYSYPPIWNRPGYINYPFLDRFGKTVALDVSSNQLFLFVASTTKPIVERTKFCPDGICSEDMSLLGSTCNNTNLNKTHCGYIHVFRVDDDPISGGNADNLKAIKTQKIYETEASILPSGKYRGFFYKANKFGSCIIAENGKLIFGQTKPADFHSASNGSIETSKIFIYQRSGNTYNKISTIENARHNNFNFNTYFSITEQGELYNEFGIDHFDHKEFYLRDKYNDADISPYTDFTTGDYYYPPDRFGTCFKWNENLLVANAFDVYNEDNEFHATNNFFEGTDGIPPAAYTFNLPIDYLHVYEKNDSSWNFVSKIAPAFDQFDSTYSYSDILGPNVYNSIRSLGNRNYKNNSFNSKTWDIDLTGRYDLVNDRILLKDPLSYSVFQKSVDYISTSRTPIRLTLDKYFTYDEKYQAESGMTTACQLKFDRISAVHKYDNYLDDYKNLYCENNKNITIPTLNYRAPIYFINIPINSENISTFSTITLKLEEIRSVNAGVNLKLVLFKKDPRTTIYPLYNNLCTPNASDDIQKKWRSSFGHNLQTFAIGGVFDSSLYADGSSGDVWSPCEGSSCMAKLINASSILVSGSRRDYTFTIDNSQVDINDYIITNNLILNSSNNRTIGRSGVPTEVIEFDDIANIGYDTSVSVEASIIVGFIYQPMNYKIDSTFSARADVRIIDITFDGYNSAPPSPTTDVDYTYSCKFNKVVSFDYFRNYYNNPANKVTLSSEDGPAAYIVDGKLRHSNPIMMAGVVPTASFNDNRSGTIQGVYSKSYEVLSIDDFGTTPETSIFTNTRSLDLHYLETLPLYIQATDSIPYINLFLKTLEPKSSDFNLFLQNQASENNLTLYIPPLAQASGFQNLRIEGVFYATGDLTQHIVGGPSIATTLFMKVPDPASGSFNTYLRGFDRASGDMTLYIGDIVQKVAPLFLKSRDAIASTGNFNQTIYGSPDGSSFNFSANNANLFINVFNDSRRSAENNFPLNITGPDSFTQSGVNNMPLYIGQIVRNSSGDFSLVNFGGFGGNITASGGRLDLYLNNSGIESSGSMPLSIPNKGFNGADVIADNTSLFLRQTEASGALNLISNGAFGSSSGLDMYIKTGFGVLSSGTTTFIRGFRS